MFKNLFLQGKSRGSYYLLHRVMHQTLNLVLFSLVS